MEKIRKHKPAFSLAEALITLLIVCLITLASVPVLTKKKRELSNNEHGKWMCTRNSAGSHVYWSKEAQNGDPDNPETWTVAGNQCKFVSPGTARNFSVTAVSGGGGGAGAEAMPKSWESSFNVESYGIYKMVAIGGGGRGGRQSGDGPAGSAAAGIAGSLSYVIDSNVLSFDMSAGAGGGGGNYNGGSGGTSQIYIYKRNTSNGNTDHILLLKVAGGDGGNGAWNGNDDKGDTAWPYWIYNKGFYQGVSGYREHWDDRYKGDGKDTSACGHGHPTLSVQREVNKVIAPYKVYPEVECSTYSYSAYCNMPGLGGPGAESASRCGPKYSGGWDGGRAGKVFVMTELYKKGGGGAAGKTVANAFYTTFKEKSFGVTVGAGGKGGAAGKKTGNNSTPAIKGEDGGATVVGDFLPLPGGAGGKVGTNAVAMQKTSGEDGEKTPLYYKVNPTLGLGGLSGINNSINGLTSPGYGAGGGGGGIDVTAGAGSGANGSPGIVTIEW